MARRQIEDQTATIIDADALDVSQQVEDDENEEADLASEFGNADGDTRLSFKVHKYTPNSKDMIYCMDGTSADMPINPKIQAIWGEGKYRIQLFKNGRFHRRWTIAIAAAPIIQTAGQPPAVNNNVIGNDPKIIALLEKLTSQNTPRTSPSMTEIAALISAAIPAVAALKELLAPPQTNQLEMIKTVAELMQTFQGDSAREPSMVEVIGNVLTKTDLIANLGTLITQAPPPQAPTQIQRPQIPNAPTPPTPAQIQVASMAQMSAQMNYLVQRAMHNSSPELYAEVILDTFDAAIIQQLTAPGAIDFICTLHPPCATYRPWFEALLTSMREQVDSGDEPVGEVALDDGEDVSPVSKQGSPNGDVQPSPWIAGNEGDAETDGEAG